MQLANIVHESGTLVLKVDNPESPAHLDLNCLYTSAGLQDRVEEKIHQNSDRLFPFVEAFIDRVTGMKENSSRTREHSRYAEL